MDEMVVRPSGRRDETGPPGPPARWIILAIGAVVVILALAGGTIGTESDRTAITPPSVPDSTPTGLPTPPPEPVASALDTLVPEMSGTLVMAVDGPSGTEVWRWQTGTDAILSRSVGVSGLFDAHPDASGTWFLGIQRGDGMPLLQAALDSKPVPVFWGVDSFAWHTVDAGAAAWVSVADTEVTFQLGHHRTEGISLKPGPIIPAAANETYRLRAFDDLGFVMEVVSAERDFSVRRFDIDGNLTGTVPGQFVGISPNGQIAVSTGGTTEFRRDADMTPGATISGAATSARWSPTGDRLAVTNVAGDTVDIIDGTTRLTVSVGEIRPWILAWSPDERFVLIGGESGGEPLITFVDTASLQIRTIFLDAAPIAAVVVP